jgi:serine protease inhibitor
MLGTRNVIAMLVLMGLAASAGAAKVDKVYVQRVTGFGFKALSELALAEPSKNVFISPASLAMALTMTYNGAAGDTLTAMQKTLELSGYTPKKASVASCALIESLESAAPDVKLSIANSLWARKGISFEPDFLAANKKYFHAEVKQIEFGPAAVKAINAWVKTKTNGKIPEIVKQTRANMILYLINAVYFKGAWTNPFDKTRTEDKPFTLANGDKITVPMMWRHGSYAYYKGSSFQAISIPYGKGRMRMYIVLSDKASGLPDLVRDLSAKTWDTWMHGFSTAMVNLSMPRFKIEYRAEDEMKAALTAMGMAVAFDPGKADFGKMAEIPGQNVYISQVAHKTYLNVNETGTEAAAATSVGMAMTAMPTRPIDMVVDHPFLCAIVDNETGAVLFVGAIMNPKG